MSRATVLGNCRIGHKLAGATKSEQDCSFASTALHDQAHCDLITRERVRTARNSSGRPTLLRHSEQFV
jgi:hypothetical protein